jgi:putative transposase
MPVPGARFVTRMKKTARFRAHHWRPLKKRKADGFTIFDDAEIRLVSKGDSSLAIPMGRIRLKREGGPKITLITNDLQRSAIDIAGLYKTRWQIELLFRWIKQYLKVRKSSTNNPNAVRLKFTAAMIAYLLLRIAARHNHIKIPPIRFAELIGLRLFARRSHRPQRQGRQSLQGTTKALSSPTRLPLCLNFPRTAPPPPGRTCGFGRRTCLPRPRGSR